MKDAKHQQQARKPSAREPVEKLSLPDIHFGALPKKNDAATSVSSMCPECGHLEKIVRDNLEKYVICKQCGGSHYVDRTGAAHRKKPESAMNWTPEESGAIPLVDDSWHISAEAVRRIVCITVVGVSVFIIGLLVVGMWSWKARLPHELVDRAVLVGNAFVYGDEATLLKVTAKGSESAAKQWLKDHRSTAWQERIDAGDIPTVEANQINGSRKLREARVMVQISTTSGSAETGNPPFWIRFELPWVLDEHDAWCFNANNLGVVPPPVDATSVAAPNKPAATAVPRAPGAPAQSR